MKSVVIVAAVVLACTPSPAPAPTAATTPMTPMTPTTPTTPNAATTSAAAPMTSDAPTCTDPSDPVCQATMPCPKPPDRRVRACIHAFPKCGEPDAPNDACGSPPPVIGRVIKAEIGGSNVYLTVDKGSNDGISSHWRIELVRGATDEPVPGITLSIVRVGKKSTVAVTTTTMDQLALPGRVRFSLPP